MGCRDAATRSVNVAGGHRGAVCCTVIGAAACRQRSGRAERLGWEGGVH